MTQQTHEQAEFTVTERVSRSHVRWTAKVGDQVIANVRRELVGGWCDSGWLTEAVAKHFGVDEDAVHYLPDRVRAGSTARTRYVPRNGRVTLPPKPVAPPTCAHLPGDEACELATCSGTPPVTTPMDRDHTPILAEPAGGDEVGTVTVGREIIDTVARRTGLPVTDGAVASNGWSDLRWGARRVEGLMFTVDGVPVRVLQYEARPPSLARYTSMLAAVYVGDSCVAPAIDQGRPDRWMGEVVRAVIDAVEKLHDERALAKPVPAGWWQLKNPPVGFNVVVQAHGIVEVTEPSRNDGMSLYVLDAEGRNFYIDRDAASTWRATYGGAVIDGTDTRARFERRRAFFDQVVEYRHQRYEHDGPAVECGECCAEASGGALGGEHRFGRFVDLPCCALCGKPRPQWVAAKQLGSCPGAPRYPDVDGTGEPDVPAGGTVPPIFSGIPHRFVPKPEGHEGGPEYCIAPCHSHRTAEVHVSAAAAAAARTDPVARVHVRSESPILIDYDNGRQGLANPAWCGRVNDEKAWHTYGLKVQTITCPVCFHLFTCQWARLDDRVDHCEVCAHIYACEDKQCNQADHPGVVPEPDPNFDRAARVDAMLQRSEQAMRDGDFDLADRLIDGAEDYEPSHRSRDGWEDLRLLVWRERKQAEQRAAASVTVANTRLEMPRIETHAANLPQDEAGVLWAAALDDLRV